MTFWWIVAAAGWYLAHRWALIVFGVTPFGRSLLRPVCFLLGPIALIVGQLRVSFTDQGSSFLFLLFAALTAAWMGSGKTLLMPPSDFPRWLAGSYFVIWPIGVAVLLRLMGSGGSSVGSGSGLSVDASKYRREGTRLMGPGMR
jgi:hypothetical protein